jgi:hypothetical protein
MDIYIFLCTCMDICIYAFNSAQEGEWVEVGKVTKSLHIYKRIHACLHMYVRIYIFKYMHGFLYVWIYVFMLSKVHVMGNGVRFTR